MRRLLLLATVFAALATPAFAQTWYVNNFAYPPGQCEALPFNGYGSWGASTPQEFYAMLIRRGDSVKVSNFKVGQSTMINYLDFTLNASISFYTDEQVCEIQSRRLVP